MTNGRALIVGNADQPIPAGINPADYSHVAIFNYCRHPELIPIATHHFLRGGAEGQIRINDEWQQSRGKVCIINIRSVANYGRDISAKARQQDRLVREIQAEEFSPRGYPRDKRPSSGLVAIQYFLKFKVPCDVVCFTFEGVEAHAWEFEREFVNGLALAGRISLPYQRPAVSRSAGAVPSGSLPISILTCTGDRQQCLAMLRRNLERQLAGWQDVRWVVIDDGAESSAPVLEGCTIPVVHVRRERHPSDPAHTLPVQLVAADPHVSGTMVLIAEDDDYYRPGWFAAALSELRAGYDLYGEGAALYYHIQAGGTYAHRNARHCSLAATCMGPKGWTALANICRRSPSDPCVDLALWKVGGLAKSIRHPAGENQILQLKGMPGRKGTLASHSNLSQYVPDIGLKILRSMIHPDDLQFYLDAHGCKEPKKIRLGVMFPCSTRESIASDIVDIATYYRRLGFDRIVICNNGGMECLRELLPFAEVIDDLRHPAQNEIMLRFAGLMQDCDWVLFCDSDEYLWERESLREFLGQAPADVSAVAISWQCFSWGGDDRNGTPSPELSVDRLPDSAHINSHVKVVARPSAIKGWPKGPHLPELASGRCIMPSGRPVATVGVPGYEIHNHLQQHEAERFTLAHFYYRSKSDARRKERHSNLFNGRPKPPMSLESILQQSTIHDESFREHYHAVLKQ